MNQLAGVSGAKQRNAGFLACAEDGGDLEFKGLNREEAQAQMSPQLLWQVVWLQMLAGFAVIAVASFWAGHAGVMTCVTAGVFSAWVPSVFFVWCMARQSQQKRSPASALMWFFIGEVIKVVMVIALLVIASMWARPLVWQALLAGFMVTVLAYAVGCWLSFGGKLISKS